MHGYLPGAAAPSEDYNRAGVWGGEVAAIILLP